MDYEEIIEIAREHGLTPEGFEEFSRGAWDVARSSYVRQVNDAMDGLRDLTRVHITGRRARMSYGLKHELERAAETYIANGCLLVAAIGLGIDVKRVTESPLNGLIGVTTQSRRPAAANVATLSGR